MSKVGVLIPELLRCLKKKPVTGKYPFEKAKVPEGFRGNPVFIAAKCIGCKACMRDCTAEAIEIELASTETPAPSADQNAPPPKPVKKFRMTIYLDRCIHCGRCAEVCPKEAIVMNTDFEIAGYSREAMKWVQE